MTGQSEGCRQSAGLTALVSWRILSVKNKAYGGCSAERAEAGTVRLWPLPSYTADSSHPCPRIRVFSRKSEAISSVHSPPLMQTEGAVHAFRSLRMLGHPLLDLFHLFPGQQQEAPGGPPCFQHYSVFSMKKCDPSNPPCPLPPRAFGSLSRQLFPQMLSRSSHLLLCLGDESRVSPRANALGGSPGWQCKR